MLKGIVIGDVHLGIPDSKRLYDELNEIFIKDLKTNHYDYLIINGDLFDKKLSMNESAASLVISFISDIMKISSERNIKVRILNGTKSHDLNQLNTLTHYMSDPKYDVKIIFQVQEEMLFPDFNVLYIPEESIENQFEYYKDYKSDNRYDMIFGHGTWSSQAFITQTDNNNISSSPILIETEWFKALKPNGKIIFGHIHERVVDSTKTLYYPGSFTAWEFGNISDKGYCTVEHDTQTKIKLVNNTLCPLYESIDVNGVDASLEDLMFAVNSHIDDKNYTMFKMLDVNPEHQVILRKTYASKNAKFNFKSTTALMDSINEDQTEFIDKYAYILKNKNSVEEMVKKYLLEDKGIDIQMDFIMKSLKNDTEID